jgi:hypothetical protein
MQKEESVLGPVLITIGLIVLIGIVSYYSSHKQPSIMELSAAQYKDTVKYSASGYTLRTITVESFIQDEDGNMFIKEENGPHFTLGNDTNLDESSVGSTFDCMLHRDDTGFTSGITVGKCVQR